VRKSLVLLKNTNGLLPLRAKMHVLVAGDAADNVGQQSGGWTVTWQGGSTNADFPGATSILTGISDSVAATGGSVQFARDGVYESKPDVAIVVFGEHPYAEWYGNIPVLDRSAKYRTGPAPAPEATEVGASCLEPARIGGASPTTSDSAQTVKAATASDAGGLGPPFSPAARELALLRTLKARGIPVVAVFLTGRPLWITQELDASDAFVVAWLPGSEGGGIGDVLVAKNDGSVNYDFTGKLSYSWPRTAGDAPANRGDANYSPLFPYGFGLTYASSGAQKNP
jgi:beta-glucosidase